jgi:ABC-type antimicrobial peptide transport system permease subunit
MIAGIDHALPGFFETIAARLQRGRFLEAGDVPAGDAAVISEQLARLFFPGRDPIGGVFQSRGGRQYRVVGVIADLRGSLDQALPVAYVIPGADTRAMTLAVRVRTHGDAMLAELERIVGERLPGEPVVARWWSTSLSSLTVFRNPRFQTLVLGGFALLGLLLTATGIFGVISEIAAGRTHEMGVRLAIGAPPASLVALLMRQAVGPVIVGAAAGLAGTSGAARLAATQRYAVDTSDARSLMLAIVAVVATAIVAAYLPARQARRIDPVLLLRAD